MIKTNWNPIYIFLLTLYLTWELLRPSSSSGTSTSVGHKPTLKTIFFSKFHYKLFGSSTEGLKQPKGDSQQIFLFIQNS